MNKITVFKNKLKLILKSPETVTKLESYYMNETNLKSPYEAFANSMKKNFPDPKELGWELITMYRGSKLVSQYMSKNTFDKYAKAGFFRMNDGMVYLEEVNYFVSAMRFVDEMYELEILKEKRIDGSNMIVLFPAKLSRANQSDLTQKMKAAFYPTTQDWFKDWVADVDFGLDS